MLHEEDVWELDLIENVESMQGFVEGIHTIGCFSVSRLKSYPRQIAKQDRILTRMMHVDLSLLKILVSILTEAIERTLASFRHILRYVSPSKKVQLVREISFELILVE